MNSNDQTHQTADPASKHPGKEITIHINTRKFTIEQKTLSYQELVNLAFPGDVPSPDKVYEITYSNEHGPDGIS